MESSKAWKIRLGKVPMLGIALILLGAFPAAAENGGRANLSSFDALVSELTRLRSEIAAEKRVWREQRPQWERETELLELEKERLQTELDRYRAEQSGAVERDENLRRRQSELEQVLGAVGRSVRRAEIDLRAIEPMIPPALRANLNEAFRQIPASDRAAEDLPLTRRLQRVLAVHSGIQKLQSEIQTARAMIELADGRREMDVLYVGLSQAYAISTDGGIAAVGRPGRAGWSWKRADGFETQIREAIAVSAREVPVRLVALPLEIDGEER